MIVERIDHSDETADLSEHHGPRSRLKPLRQRSRAKCIREAGGAWCLVDVIERQLRHILDDHLLNSRMKAGLNDEEQRGPVGSENGASQLGLPCGNEQRSRGNPPRRAAAHKARRR